MSVIIKGMKKPHSCISCPLQFGGFCGATPAWVEGRVAPTVEEAAKQRYPAWCPMEEAGGYAVIDGKEYIATVPRLKTIHGKTGEVVISGFREVMQDADSD